MDGTQFDQLSKRLATTPLTRATALRGLVASAAALIGVTRVVAPEAAKAKRLGDVKRVKICDCANERAASCNQINVIKKKAKKVLRRHECSYRGRCKDVSGCANQVGCSPANNTQGSCPAGQICNTNSICVAGCSPANNTQGSCPQGQICNTSGQCQGQGVGCNPANNTQGSCPQGQICNPNAICVAGCTGTAGTQGSCPVGQLCNTSGQCQSQPLACTPANNTQGTCPTGQHCNTSGFCQA